MVQLKYFGDDRDYFKYDLVAHILSANIFSSYSFVPMLTGDRGGKEGNIKPLKSTCKSQDLLSFVNSRGSKDLNHWEDWVLGYVNEYHVMQPVNGLFFKHEDRINYWLSHSQVIQKNNSLVFFDPDTGLQAGLKTSISKKIRERYILNEDLSCLIEGMSNSSAFMFYQHLQFNAKKRKDDVDRKLEILSGFCPSVHVCAYREKDLAFIFAAKNRTVSESIVSALEQYESKSSINPRGIHCF